MEEDGLGGSLALPAGPDHGGPLLGWTGPVGIPGMSQDCPHVWAEVGHFAGFHGGLGVFLVFFPKWCLGPYPVAPLWLLTGPSKPLAASAPRPTRVISPSSLPLSRDETVLIKVDVITWTLMDGCILEVDQGGELCADANKAAEQALIMQHSRQ